MGDKGTVHWRWMLWGILLLLVLLGAACQGSTPVPAEDAFTLFIQPEDGRAPILRVLNQARESIDVTIYLFTDEEVANALERAAARGVRVRVLMEMEPFGGGKGNAAMARRLRKAGVIVKAANPVFRYTHQKSIVVDNRIGIITTMNFTPSSFKRNREYGVIFSQPALVQEMQTVFEADWRREAPELPDPPYLVWSPVNARETILSLINSAMERLDLEQADSADDEVVAALVRAARRGVRVRLIRPSPTARETDEAAHVQELVAAGAQVAYLDSPRVHAKVIIADRRRALIGSMNLTMTSLDFNRELGVLLTDPGIIAQMLEVVEQDWQEATPVRPSRGEIPVISPDQAEQYLGQEVIVEGKVVRTYDTGKVTFLDFSRRKEDLSVVIFARNYERFPQPPAEYYRGHRIRVRGLIKRYRGALEIVVEGPEQIEILDPD